MRGVVLTATSPIRVIGLVSVSALSLFLLSPIIAHADTGAIAQTYETNSTNLGLGSLVSLTPVGSNSVGPAFSSNASNLVGIAAEKPTLELSKGDSSSVQVVVNGSTEALVSDVNGPVVAGDKITASPISGVGMKATAATEIVGTALKNLSDVKTVNENVTASSGKSVTIRVGLLPVAVTVVYFANEAPNGNVSSFVPPFLQSVAYAITGKAVSPLRILIGTLLLLLGFVTVAVILYGGVRSHIISIGRNPLAQRALHRGLADVLIAGFGILILTGVISYAILLN